MKAILVMEMPESCACCKIRKGYVCRGFSGIYGKALEPRLIKPDWCPLKPIPERKMNINNYEFAAGWNACIDVIEGSKG